MIRQDGSRQRLVCDACRFAGPAHDRRAFEKMIAAARDDGWAITRRAGAYVHSCPGCVRVEAPNVQRRMF